MTANHKDTYVKAFSTLQLGLPLYEPGEAQLGDIGFIDSTEGLFHKLYNVTNPPTGKPDCPPAIKLVRGEPRKEHMDSIHLTSNASRGATGRVDIPVAPTGTTARLEFNFTRVRGRECILIPGDFVVKERLEELGGLIEYMNDHHRWIQKEFAKRHHFNLKQLILVVGTLKTERWAIAVTSENEFIEDLAFSISSASAKCWGHWTKNVSMSRSGPYSADNTPNTTADQTLFIRRIALRSEMLRGKKWAPSLPPRTLMQRLYAAIVDTDESEKCQK